MQYNRAFSASPFTGDKVVAIQDHVLRVLRVPFGEEACSGDPFTMQDWLNETVRFLRKTPKP